MKNVVWSKDNCPYCNKAIQMLDLHGYEYEVKKIGEGYTKEDLLEEVPSARSVPQIFINGSLIGGYTELEKYIEETAGGFGEGRM